MSSILHIFSVKRKYTKVTIFRKALLFANPYTSYFKFHIGQAAFYATF